MLELCFRTVPTLTAIHISRTICQCQNAANVLGMIQLAQQEANKYKQKNKNSIA